MRLFHVHVFDAASEFYRDSGEGPFRAFEEAYTFAAAEVRAAWMIVCHGVTLPNFPDRELEEDIVLTDADGWYSFAVVDNAATVGIAYSCQREKEIGTFAYSPLMQVVLFSPYDRFCSMH